MKHHKMCSKCQPWAPHKQRDGDATDWWLQQQSNGPAFCIRLTVSVSVLQDVIQRKRLRSKGLHRLHWKCNCSCVLTRLRNKCCKFYKMSSVLNEIKLKILWLFLWTQCIFIKWTGRTANFSWQHHNIVQLINFIIIIIIVIIIIITYNMNGRIQ